MFDVHIHISFSMKNDPRKTGEEFVFLKIGQSDHDASRKLRIFNSTDEERSFLSKRLETFYDLCTQFLLISQSQTI